jgi:hypothetical protein
VHTTTAHGLSVTGGDRSNRGDRVGLRRADIQVGAPNGANSRTSGDRSVVERPSGLRGSLGRLRQAHVDRLEALRTLLEVELDRLALLE